MIDINASWIFANNGAVLDAAWTAMDQTYGLPFASVESKLAWTDNTGHNGDNPFLPLDAGWTVVGQPIKGEYGGKFVI